MPDGDRVHGGLTQAYEKPYEQLCEGHFGPDEIAYNLLGAVKEDLKRGGNEPIELVLQVADQLAQLPQGALLRGAIDWHQESREIESKARQLAGTNKRAMNLAVVACKKLLREMEYGLDVADLRHALVRAYMERVYDANFTERVPLGIQHHGIDRSTLMERMHEARPFVLESLDAFVRQSIRRRSVVRLRRPSGLRHPIDADTDLLS